MIPLPYCTGKLPGTKVLVRQVARRHGDRRAEGGMNFRHSRLAVVFSGRPSPLPALFSQKNDLPVAC